MRPLPSDSTHDHVTGLGHGEVRAADAHLHRQELRAQVRARRGGQLGGVVGDLDAELAAEQRGDLGAVAVDGGDEDVRGVSPESWMISSARSVSDRVDAVAPERVVEVDLVGGQRLDLDDLVGAVARGRRRPRPRRPRRRRAPSARCRRRAVTDSSRRSSWTSRWRSARVLDLRAGVAQRLPVGHLGDHPRALVADRPRRVAEVAPQLAVGQRGARRRAGSRPSRRPRWPGSRRGASTRTPARAGAAPPPMCMRQELSAAVQTSAPVSRMRRTLSVSIAVEVSAFLIAKVPPKPQHCSAPGSSTRSIPRTARSSRSGASPTFSSRSEWHVGC